MSEKEKEMIIIALSDMLIHQANSINAIYKQKDIKNLIKKIINGDLYEKDISK